MTHTHNHWKRARRNIRVRCTSPHICTGRCPHKEWFPSNSARSPWRKLEVLRSWTTCRNNRWFRYTGQSYVGRDVSSQPEKVISWVVQKQQVWSINLVFLYLKEVACLEGGGGLIGVIKKAFTKLWLAGKSQLYFWHLNSKQAKCEPFS